MSDTRPRRRIYRSSRLSVLAASLALALVTVGARADDYGDAAQLLRAGKPADALSRVEQALSAHPRDAQLRFLKGVIQAETGKSADAIQTFTRLTEDHPDLPEPYNNLAVLYAAQNQYDKARMALELAIRTNPSYATAQRNLGDVYGRLAAQAYGKALQLDANEAPPAPPRLALIHDLYAQAATPPAKPAPPPAPVPPAVVAAAPAPAAAAKPAPAPAAAPAKPAAPAASAEKEVAAAVQAWAAAWAARDMTAYFAAYGKDFNPPGKTSRKAWESERRQRILSKSRISVRLNGLTVSVEGNKATARFKQDYNADALSVSSRKTLNLVKVGERWLIVRESTGS